jgi:hypothetical protein
VAGPIECASAGNQRQLFAWSVLGEVLSWRGFGTDGLNAFDVVAELTLEGVDEVDLIAWAQFA